MAEITKELGIVPVSRGEFNSTTIYYKDNIVQYKRGSYQVLSESPIVGVPPTNNKNVVNPGWTLFAGTLDAQDVVNQIKEQEAQSIQAIADREAEILAKSDAAKVSFDNTGTSLSGTNVQDALKETDNKLSELESEVIYDVTANNDGATFLSLSALLLSDNLSTLIPTSVRHGGMSIRFVQSSDNKYIQARLMANSFTTDISAWQSVDDKIKVGSKNLIESGAVEKWLAKTEETVDDPTGELGIINVSGVVSSFQGYTIVRAIKLEPNTSILLNKGNSLYLGQNCAVLFKTDNEGNWIETLKVGDASEKKVAFTNTTENDMYVGTCTYTDQRSYVITKLQMPASQADIASLGFTSSYTFNQFIKELYLTGLDSSTSYYIYQISKTDGGSYYFNLLKNGVSGNIATGYLSASADKVSFVKITQQNSSGIEGYAVVDWSVIDFGSYTFTESSRAMINNALASDLNFSPTIYAYLNAENKATKISNLETLVVDGLSIKTGGEDGKYIGKDGAINTSNGGVTNYIIIPNKYFKKIVADVGAGDRVPAIAFFNGLPIGISTFISSIQRNESDNIYSSDSIPTDCKYIGFNTPSAYAENLKIDCYNDMNIISDVINEHIEGYEEFKDEWNGIKRITWYLEDIRGSGEMLGYYIHNSTYKPTGSNNTIITKPLFLYVGDTVTAKTGGTGFISFAKSPTATITTETVFTPVSTGNTYSGAISEEGYYCFSGRINRQDDTNLELEIHTHIQSPSIKDIINNKIDKSELNVFGNSIGLSIGAKDVKSEIPNYWFKTIEPSEQLYNLLGYNTYLDNKIDSVPEGKHFIFITDVHYAGQPHCRSAEIIDYVRRRLGIKTIVHGGDVENENADISLAAKQWLDFNADFVFRLGGDFKQVCGDHDHNGRHANSDPALNQAFPYAFVQKMLNDYNINELHYDTLYDERIATYGWSDADMVEYDAWKKMHYYYDDTTIKTRFIVLHTGWTGNVGLAVDKIGLNALNEQYSTYLQMDFLYQSLMTTPNGYNIVIIGHNVVGNKSYNVEGNIRYSLTEPEWKGSWQQIAKMLRAFNSKSISPSITYRDWSGNNTMSKTYDFTNAPTAGFAFCLGGDVHWDILAKSQTASETLANVSNGTHINKNSDILHVVTMTDGGDRAYRSYPDGELIAPLRTEGTIDEQAFDIITISDNAIYFTRIGAGNDRVVYID